MANPSNSRADQAGEDRPPTPPRRRPPRRRVEVRRVTRLTPRMVRVTVGGDELAGWDPDPGPAAHLKVFVPVDGTGEPAMRTYTARRFDPHALELDLEFFLHGTGPASRWAAGCAPGDAVTVAGPRGTYRPDPSADWYLLLGDEAALPAVAAILEVLPPAARVLAWVEVAGAADELDPAAPDGAELTWLHRDGTAPGARLTAALQTLELPAGNGEVWVGCEATAMRAIRRHLLTDRGLERGAIHTRGYWKAGVVNHPDHDTGEDEA